MKIVITGGAGFIGTHLTQAYLDAGHDVIVIDNLSHAYTQQVDPRARFYQIDIRDERFRTILQHERPTLVSHHATLPALLPAERIMADADIHIRGLLNVLDSCVNASVHRLIFASGSDTMYGKQPGLITEDTALYPTSAHDISMTTGEWYVRHYTQQFGLKHTILRYTNVYGDLQARHPISYFISMLLNNQRSIIRGAGTDMRDHIFIDDVVQANLNVLQQGENSTLHISSAQGFSLKQIYSQVARLLGSDLEPGYITGPLSEYPSVILDHKQTQQILKWQPRIALNEGIAHTLLRIQQTYSAPNTATTLTRV